MTLDFYSNLKDKDTNTTNCNADNSRLNIVFSCGMCDNESQTLGEMAHKKRHLVKVRHGICQKFYTAGFSG